MKEFKVVGRVMNGNSVDGYIVKSQFTGIQKPVTKGLLVDLINKQAIENCTYQVGTNGDVIFRGAGVKLSQLPSVQSKGTPKAVQDTYTANANNNCNKVNIVAEVRNGSSHFGYVVQDCNNNKQVVDKANAFKLAKDNGIGNARVQKNGGSEIFRGYGIRLTDLPVIQLGQLSR